MSPTKKGKKPIGYDLWGKEPKIDDKQARHQIERARSKQSLLKEPREPEYDPGEDVPDHSGEDLSKIFIVLRRFFK
jgi:hypothetical protein